MGTGKTSNLLKSDFFSPASNVLVITSTQQLTNKWFMDVRDHVHSFINPIEDKIHEYIHSKLQFLEDKFSGKLDHNAEFTLDTPPGFDYFPDIDHIYYKQLRPNSSDILLRVPKLTQQLDDLITSQPDNIAEIRSLKNKIKHLSAVYSSHDGINHYPMKCITTPESLHHIFKHRSHWDFVVIDEANLVFQNFTGDTMHHRISSSFSCSKLITMDHSLNNFTVDIVKSLSDNSPSHTFVNTGGRFDGNCHIFPTRRKVTDKMLSFEHPFVIVSNSRDVVTTMCQKVANKFPKKKILEFIGVREEDFYDDVHDVVKRDLYLEAIDKHLETRLLISINENNPDFWNNYDVFAFSPTITVGIDFQITRFKHIFGFFTHKSCNYETCLQMLRRFRNITDFTISNNADDNLYNHTI